MSVSSSFNTLNNCLPPTNTEPIAIKTLKNNNISEEERIYHPSTREELLEKKALLEDIIEKRKSLGVITLKELGLPRD